MRTALVFAAAAVATAKQLSDAEMEHFYGPKKVHTGPITLLTPKDASQTLRQAAAARGIYIGSEIRLPSLQNASDTLYNATAIAQFNLLTAENECKWGATEPGNGQYDLAACGDLAVFAQANGMAHRLHNLDWGVYNPQWLNSITDPSVLNSSMTDHAAKLVTAFGPGGGYPTAFCTDAVNEAISDDGDPNVIFKNADPWYPALPDYVATQFYAARAANPSIKLFYNEYGAEGAGPKSDKVYNMVKGFISRGVPIDGVGLQMHVSTDYYPAFADVSANMARLAALGLEVHVTEMDVKCAPPCGQDKLALQASIYGGMLSACLNNTAPAGGKGGCKSFETWGFTDRYTWVGPENVPLPFDFNYQPKPAFYQMLAVLQG